jgi:hypothetical protein
VRFTDQFYREKEALAAPSSQRNRAGRGSDPPWRRNVAERAAANTPSPMSYRSAAGRTSGG